MNFLEKIISKLAKLELNENETLIYQGGANLFRSNEASGGMLYLTSEKLVFVAHKMNMDSTKQEIVINDIVGFKKVRNVIFNNGLVIESKNGTYRFVLNSRDKWITEIEKRQDSNEIS